MLLRPWKDSHDDQDGRVHLVQDKIVQKVQCKRVLPLRTALPIHPRHIGDQPCLDPAGPKTQAGSGDEIVALAVASAYSKSELELLKRANLAGS